MGGLILFGNEDIALCIPFLSSAMCTLMSVNSKASNTSVSSKTPDPSCLRDSFDFSDLNNNNNVSFQELSILCYVRHSLLFRSSEFITD